MKIKVRYFALLRDYTKKNEEIIETECKDVACLVSQLEKVYGKEFGRVVREGFGPVRIVILVNGKVNNEIREGDEVALLPPPAGGELFVNSRFNLLEEIRKFRAEATEEVGSMVIYLGIVKGAIEGHKVYELRYEAYKEYTEKRLNEIIENLQTKYKDLVKMKILHVVDDLKPGDDVFLVMALGRGRGDTLKAVEEAVELVKHTTGIWKLEIRDDGEYWVVAGNTRVKRDEKASSS
ncbi:molybdenum biosynthesis protein MoaD [Sulfolobus acidocaldarius SUSAZ]|nr:molybdenum biosynthesis protein MoaD [Sulfolobus acidocaldarius SUSAZ]